MPETNEGLVEYFLDTEARKLEFENRDREVEALVSCQGIILSITKAEGKCNELMRTAIVSRD